MRHALILIGLLSGPACTPAFAELSLREAAAGLDLFPCEMSNLSCTTLTVPLDHWANDPDRTLDITFALSFASGESRGILFYFVGGPGGSGLASTDSYLAAFDPSLAESMDIVFVDQRGTGAVHGLACPTAQARFDIAPVSIDDPEGVLETAGRFVTDCTAELDADWLLPFVNTDQAIRDSEALRQALGGPKVWLYGESYGTQLVQAYATQFPQAVRGVILDGVVDLTLDAEGFYRRYTLAAEALLAETFALCDALPACAADIPGGAAAAYDDLARRAAEAPIPVPYPLADDTMATRHLTTGFLEANAFFALYSPEGRAEFLRALAAASRGNLVPMLQLGYLNMYIDPETEIGILDPGWFGAAYFAITCSDYGSGAGTPEERARRILDEARALRPMAPRLLRSYYLERVACALWPHQGPDRRPAPYAGGDWPTLVLNGDRDPITPASMAYSVLDAARNAYGVFMAGGSHVIWGRGQACPDRIVQALLYDGTLPAAREQLCQQEPMADYIPLTLTDPAERSDPFAVARAVETELFGMIALSGWDGQHATSFGCPFGGTVAAAATDAGTDYSFSSCRYWPEIAVQGTATDRLVADTADSLSLEIEVSGQVSGQLSWHHDRIDQSYRLSGSWNGGPASLPRGKL
ncbi:alpha/beta fold hydrolase [Rhodobacter calidifons]|uniref:Alpha/beta fold hydrolase n=1 Tax=Rhodobacter calidifons TaxID=2715277 RepID=A0ABX0G4D9_9RHOB|nr:alpha/beta hydrolase [Rhodobacter calidifons]NHB75994.1 alpha/beta fold hydrolase [Rhodobacter calidifons]